MSFEVANLTCQASSDAGLLKGYEHTVTVTSLSFAGMTTTAKSDLDDLLHRAVRFPKFGLLGKDKEAPRDKRGPNRN